MAADPKKLVKRWQALWDEQANFRNLWEDIDDYIAPHKDPANTLETPGEQRTQKLFEGTAPWA